MPPISALYLRYRCWRQSFLFWLLITSFFLADPANLFVDVDVTLPEIGRQHLPSPFAQTLNFDHTSIVLLTKIFPIADLIFVYVQDYGDLSVLVTGTCFVLHKDIEALRRHMAYRGMVETRLSGSEEKAQD